MILYVHHTKTANVGDRFCAPYHYFNLGAPFKVCHVGDAPGERKYSAIVFGGGVIGNVSIERWRKARTSIRIGWGIGISRHNTTLPGMAQAGLTLLGARDYRLRNEPGVEFVPCVSCMSPLFDEKYVTRRAIGVFTNAAGNIKRKSGVDIMGVTGKDRMENVGTMEDAIRFIGESEVVATNSYHGAYWAALLGRKVLLVNPYSSKFHGYEMQPRHIKAPFALLPSDVTGMATGFKGALEHARVRNLMFADKVRGILC